MSIVGFNFTKIEAERKKNIPSKMKREYNIEISGASEMKINMGKNEQKSLEVLFKYRSGFEPDVGHVAIEGKLIYMAEGKVVDESLKAWKKNKQLPDEVGGAVLGTVLNKCSIMALIMSREVNLPADIRVPKVGIKKKK